MKSIIILILLLFPLFSEEHPASHRPDGYSDVNIEKDHMQLFGVTTKKVSLRDLTKVIRTVGIVSVDERKISNIQTKFSGWIDTLFVNFTGTYVNKGDPLFTIYSPDLLSAQEELLLAFKDLDRRKEGRFKKELEESGQALLGAAKKRLELWDVPEEEIERLIKTKVATKNISINSPVAGIVLEKNGFAGMKIDPDMNIFSVADLSSIWILADIYEQDISFLKIGQKASFTLSALPGISFSGDVSFIYPVLDTVTRTMKVRFQIENAKLNLKPGMYATVELEVNMGKVLSVPESAVINTGERVIVFVRTMVGHFEPREVKLGFKAGSYYQVIDGLKQGDKVVTGAQFLIDSESRLKGKGGGMGDHGDMKKNG